MVRLGVVLILLIASPAFAQTYVSAAVSGDLSRSFESTAYGSSLDGGDTEAIGWALRVGTSFGEAWGVELEFHRSGELDMRQNPIIYAQSLSFDYFPGAGSLVTGIEMLPQNSSSVIYPAFEVEIEQRTITWNAVAWVRRPVGARASLRVLGGIGFSRVAQDIDYSFAGFPGLPEAAIRAPSSESIAYGAGALVGAEVSVRMTDRVELTPGLRVQALGNALAPGLLLRPSVAISWIF